MYGPLVIVITFITMSKGLTPTHLAGLPLTAITVPQQKVYLWLLHTALNWHFILASKPL